MDSVQQGLGGLPTFMLHGEAFQADAGCTVGLVAKEFFNA